MARNYPADTRAQKMFEELYEKETVAQLNWFLKCQEARKQNDAVPLTAAVIKEVQPSNIPELIQNYKIKHKIEKDDLKPKENERSLVSLTKDYKLDEPEMHPPNKDVLNLLYDGISKEGKGRMQYLKERKKLSNEDKFQYPILNSMEYGWGHGALISQTTAESKKFGRSAIVEDSFYRRTGIPIKHGFQMLGLDKQNI